MAVLVALQEAMGVHRFLVCLSPHPEPVRVKGPVAARSEDTEPGGGPVLEVASKRHPGRHRGVPQRPLTPAKGVVLRPEG